jgi:mono/diheme cytochrome c family protein
LLLPLLVYRSTPVDGAVGVYTYHNDNTRMGVNSNETALTLANVNTNHFGKLFSYAVDGFVYAQPLVATNVTIPGKGTHNVVLVATEHDSIYAFDADDNGGSNAGPLWKTSFLGPGVTTVSPGQIGSSDITPEVGITSTPVIDPVTGTLYCEVKTAEGSGANVQFVHRLHALDIATGLERGEFGSPVVIVCTNYLGVGIGNAGVPDNDGKNPSHVLWQPMLEHCRPALTLLNGVVYAAFASHSDQRPYHGWLFGYNATNFSETPTVFNATPNGEEGGFWQGGGGPCADEEGNLYFQTGNGTMDGGTNITKTNNYGMCVLKLSTSNGLNLVDYFAPSNSADLSAFDEDLGSAAPVFLPDSAGSAAHPHLIVGGGKTWPIYLMDRDNLGRFSGTSGSNQIVQQFNGGSAGDRALTPAFFANRLYLTDWNNRIGAFTISNGIFDTNATETPEVYNNNGGATVCISSDGASNGIAWAIYNDGGAPTTPGILKAYNATNLTQELYSSDQLPARDSAGDAVKFTLPTIANGKVYVGGQYSITVYGLAETFVAGPEITPSGGTFTNSVVVTLSEATPGASIYYTLDGTIPTTNSTLYTAPFILTNSASITAVGFKTGAAASGPTSASFVDSSAIGAGIGLIGQYWSDTPLAIYGTSEMSPTPTLIRIDPTIDFLWGTNSPSPAIEANDYVVVWYGAIQAQYDEDYTLSTTADDGLLCAVNGQYLFGEWLYEGPTTWSGSIHLAAQQYYNIILYHFHSSGPAEARLFWSSPSTGPMTVIPQSQLYPIYIWPPSVTITSPTNGETFTGNATVTVSANAASDYNKITAVNFYLGTNLLGGVSNAPYTYTVTGLAAGSYALEAVAVDGAGYCSTSSVSITINPGSGFAYGLSNAPVAPAFYNMPPAFGGKLPERLSATGLFKGVAAMVPADGLIPYNPNVGLWADGATALHYLSAPNDGTSLTPDRQIGYAPTGGWSFPGGTVFALTLRLNTNQSDPAAVRRLETRVLVRDTNGAVYGVTYKWRPDNSDADLLRSNLTEAIVITNSATGSTWVQNWYYPSSTDCLICHNATANYVLGMNARELNGNLRYPNGVVDNQLRALNHAGLLYPAIDESEIPGLARLADLADLSASTEERIRSYLDVNCAQCHQPGGTGPTFDGRYDTPLTNQNLINTAAVKGNFGYDHFQIVAPNDVWRSSLYYRMNEAGARSEMPPLAHNLIDSNAVQIMAQWINGLGGAPTLAPPIIAPNGGTFQEFINVALQGPDTNALVYYTLDGTTPTTNSEVYDGPFLVTNNAMVTANAWEAGYMNSVISTAQFAIKPGVSFTSSPGFTNGVFQMAFNGPPGFTYLLQVSTNLTQWSSILTNTPTVSPFVLSDPGGPSRAARFYRIVLER